MRFLKTFAVLLMVLTTVVPAQTWAGCGGWGRARQYRGSCAGGSCGTSYTSVQVRGYTTGCTTGSCSQPGMIYSTPQAPAKSTPQTPAPQAAAAPQYGDPTGFVIVLNNIRAQSGLPAVAYDINLLGICQENNRWQRWKGLGHWATGGCRQNSGWNYQSAQHAAQGWMTSSGHRALMLAPEIRSVAVAWDGTYWTMTAR